MNTKTACIFLIGMALLVLVSACQPQSPLSSPTSAPPDRLLFFGNSITHYNFGVSQHIKRLAASADRPVMVEVQEITFGEVRLIDLIDSSRKPTIEEGNWDVVILQEDPHWATREEFFIAVRAFDREIKSAGAETVLFMTWERNTLKKFVTTEDIAKNHMEIAAELGIKVAPVGLAWKRSMEERPDLELYDPDREHPSARGTYLAACVLYATIYERNPLGLDHQPADLIADVDALDYKWKQWLMTDEEVAFLQRTAWETFLDYQAENQE